MGWLARIDKLVSVNELALSSWQIRVHECKKIKKLIPTGDAPVPSTGFVRSTGLAATELVATTAVVTTT